MLAIENKPLSVCYLAPSRFTVETVKHGVENPFLKKGEWRIRVASEAPFSLRKLEAEAVVEFASCGEDSRSIKRFTKKYGPLSSTGSDRWVETLARWADLQYQFQETWDALIGVEHRRPAVSMFRDEYHALRSEELRLKASLTGNARPRKCQAAGTFTLNGPALVFAAESLYAALLVKLFTLASGGRLRRCENPECCFLPYFLLSADRRKFCCLECSTFGKRQTKLEWWNTTGRARRSKKATPTESATGIERKSDGTHKAR